jgi:microcystin-dependent protein
MSGGVGFGNFTYAPEATTAARNNDFYVLTSEPEPAAVTRIIAGNASIVVDPSGGTGAVTLTVPPPIIPPTFAPGMIMMYSTLVAPPVAPDGWKICNGDPGTPDLRDRFIIGAGLSWAVTQTGGAASTVIALNMLPDHTHGGTGLGTDSGTKTAGFSFTNGSNSTTGINSAGYGGGGDPLPTLPPFYALFYIIKT